MRKLNPKTFTRQARVPGSRDQDLNQMVELAVVTDIQGDNQTPELHPLGPHSFHGFLSAVSSVLLGLSPALCQHVDI